MAEVKNITPLEAHRLLGKAVFLDRREISERRAVRITPSALVSENADEVHVAQDAEIIIYCASGRRSELLAEELVARGYSNVSNMEGGIEAWQKEGLSVVGDISADERERYSRQMLLPEVGLEGQERLLRSRVFIIGAGGLGSPVALYLAAAGVGQIAIADGDRVELSNLQRQIAHRTSSVGEWKVDSAAQALGELNPGTQLRLHRERVDRDNIEEMIGGYDVVVDGSDNFAARYAASWAAKREGLPFVSAAILGFEGQISTFSPDGACYGCLFPEAPPPEMAPSCSENGIVGSVAGLLGVLESNEVLKILLGQGETLEGRLLLVDALGTRFREVSVHQDPLCRICQGELPDLEELCAI